MSVLCSVCQRVKFRYTCPRCEALYCSLDCYRDHSVGCVDRFYRDQVENELKSQRADDGERRKLERVMYQLNQLDAPEDDESEADDDDQEISAERLEVLAAKAAQGHLSFEDLTEEEARRFHSQLKRGALVQSLQAWEPWWERAAVIDLDSLDDEPFPSMSSIGAAPMHVCCCEGVVWILDPKNCLQGVEGKPARQANPSVALTVLEVVYAYVHVMRSFNGDWSWDPMQAAMHLLHLAPAICSHRLVENSVACLQASLVAAAGLPGAGFGFALDEHCLYDTASVLLGGAMTVVRALRELAIWLQHAEEEAAVKCQSKCSRLRRGKKKLDFLASFAYYHESALTPLGFEAQRFAKSRGQEERARRDSESRRLGGGVALPSRVAAEEQSPTLVQIAVP